MAMYVDTSVPSLNLGDEVPNFEAESLKGPQVLHDWINDQQTWEPGEETWVLILLLPKPRHPVVASEFVKLGSETLQKQLKLRRCVADEMAAVPVRLLSPPPPPLPPPSPSPPPPTTTTTTTRVRVVCIVADTLYSVRSFLNELDELGEEPPDLSSVQILVDDDCELHRLFGGVRPGAENGAKGRVPSLSLYLVRVCECTSTRRRQLLTVSTAHPCCSLRRPSLIHPLSPPRNPSTHAITRGSVRLSARRLRR